MIYLIKFTLCLGLLLAFYHLFLEKEKMHQFNRFFLLGSIFFSLLIPFYVIESSPTPLESILIQNNNINTTENSASVIMNFNSTLEYLSNFFIAMYFIIGGLFFIRFAKNLTDIFQKIKNNQKMNLQKAKVVLLQEQILPHTFLNYIFINKEEFEKKKVEEELLTHELAHVAQKHTFDILLVEVLQIIFWFNPLIIFLKRAIRLNHEFLADDAAITSHKNIAYYQQLLLNKATSNFNSHLASNINYSLTKKRFLMMTTSKSNSAIFFKKILIIPMLIGLGFLFSNKTYAQQKGVSKEMLKEYISIAKKVDHEGAKSVSEKDLKRYEKIYYDMTDVQREKATMVLTQINDQIKEKELYEKRHHEKHDGDKGNHDKDKLHKKHKKLEKEKKKKEMKENKKVKKELKKKEKMEKKKKMKELKKLK